MQSVIILTNVVSSNPGSAEVYSIQHYVIKFVSDLRQISGFFLDTSVSSTNKTECHDITEIFLKVALNTIPITLSVWCHVRYTIIHYDCPIMRKAIKIYWPIGQHVSVCPRVSVKHCNVLNINCYCPKKIHDYIISVRTNEKSQIINTLIRW